MKTNTKSAVNRAIIALLLTMTLFAYGCPYHRLDEKPGNNIKEKEGEEKHEHIPDTSDPVRLNRF